MHNGMAIRVFFHVGWCLLKSSAIRSYFSKINEKSESRVWKLRFAVSENIAEALTFSALREQYHFNKNSNIGLNEAILAAPLIRAREVFHTSLRK